MYNYEYEEEVLCCLRILKYLHDTNEYEGFFEAYCNDDMDMDMMYEIANQAIWELCSEVITSMDDDAETFTLSSPLIDRHIELCQLLHQQPLAVYTQKVMDIACFFLADRSHSVLDLHCQTRGETVAVQYWLNSDYYDGLRFGNEIVDFLLYFERENAFMEKQLQKEQNIQQIVPETRGREAA